MASTTSVPAQALLWIQRGQLRPRLRRKEHGLHASRRILAPGLNWLERAIDVLLQELRLCVYTILNMVPQGLCLMAPNCGSWGAPNRGTSMRSIINPAGQTAYPSVHMSNVMVSRTLGNLIQRGREVYTCGECQ